MIDLLKRDDLISIKHLNELLKGLNHKEEIEERKAHTWLIVLLVAVGLAVAGVVVYKLFFEADDYDYDEFDDDFEDMDYDDDYDDFDDYTEEEEVIEEDLDFVEDEDEEEEEETEA